MKRANEERASESLKEFQDQQAEAYKNTTGHVFLNPHWDPVSSAPPSQSVTGYRDAVPRELMDEKKPRSSFKELLSKVKSNTKESRMNISRQGSSGKSKKIAENDKVKYALQELQSVEDSAKCNVLKTLAMKEVAGTSRTKGSDRVKERLGKSTEMKTVNSELRKVGDSSKAWEELASVEESALLQVRERLSKNTKYEVNK